MQHLPPPPAPPRALAQHPQPSFQPAAALYYPLGPPPMPYPHAGTSRLPPFVLDQSGYSVGLRPMPPPPSAAAAASSSSSAAVLYPPHYTQHFYYPPPPPYPSHLHDPLARPHFQHHHQQQQQVAFSPDRPPAGAGPEQAHTASPNIQLPSIAAFLNPRAPGSHRAHAQRQQHQRQWSASDGKGEASHRRLVYPRPPAVDPRNVPLPASPDAVIVSRGASACGKPSSASPKRRRQTAAGSSTSTSGGQPALKNKPSLEDVLLPPSEPASTGAGSPVKRARTTSAAKSTGSGKQREHVKIREASVTSSSDGSEFDILEPYISRPAPAASSFALSLRAGTHGPQKTPMRASTSLPALLADLNSDDEDDEANESFTPSSVRVGLVTPSRTSLLDSVLSDSSRGASGRRRWAAAANGRRVVENGKTVEGASPRGELDGPMMSRSSSYPAYLGARQLQHEQSLLPPPPTPSARPAFLPSATPSSLRPFLPLPPALNTSSANARNPALSSIFTFPLASADALRSPGALSSPAKQLSAPPLAGARVGGGHRREPSKAETECYWLSSPSDSTRDAEADEDGAVAPAPASEDELSSSSDPEEEDNDDDDDDNNALPASVHQVFGSASSDPHTATIRSPPAASTFKRLPAPRIQPLAYLPHPPSAPASSDSATAADESAPAPTSFGRLVSAAASVGELDADGRSPTSDKENRELGAGDVFGGGGREGGKVDGRMLQPAVAEAEKPKGRKKKSAQSASATSPVIQECDLPPINVPAGPRSSAKPAFSYAAMIGQAILAHPRARLSLAEIYNWISAAYPFYRKGEAGWMNSIRHNLSLNKCFVKVEREKSSVVVGKGMLWAIESGCEHQFEGGGFYKSGKGPAAKLKAAGSKSSTPAPSTGANAIGTKKRKAGVVTSNEESDRSASPAQSQQARRVKLKVAIDSSPQILDARFAPQSDRALSPAPLSESEGSSPEAHTTALPTLAAAFEHQQDATRLPASMHDLHRPAPVTTYEQAVGGRLLAQVSSSDDYATPQRPLSRGPPGTATAAHVLTTTGGASLEMGPPLSGLRGVPHLTPSLSSPASSSPAQPFVPRPQAIQAHQALLKSSLGQSESAVTIVEDAQSYDEGLAAATATPAGLAPGFQISKSTSPRPALGPTSPSAATTRFNSGITPGIQSPMSSLRATAHDDEAEPSGPHAWTAGTPTYGYAYTRHGHLSPLHNRKVSVGGATLTDRGRGLSATGELIHHAMREPPSAGTTFKTPGMQPIAASPRETLAPSWPYSHPGGPASPGGIPSGVAVPRRALLLGAAAATPKNVYGLASSTPARTPLASHHHPTQSPAGAALLQRRAELGLLGAELTYGDDDNDDATCSSVALGGGGVRRASVVALTGDPYDSGSAVEHELRHIGSKVAESPGGPAGWGGSGRPVVATPGRGLASGWDEVEASPGYELGSPGRPRYVFR